MTDPLSSLSKPLEVTTFSTQPLILPHASLGRNLGKPKRLNRCRPMKGIKTRQVSRQQGAFIRKYHTDANLFAQHHRNLSLYSNQTHAFMTWRQA